MFLRQIAQIKPFTAIHQIQKGNFWGWVNMIFNRVDRQRLAIVGPERLCTEWLMKNGACVRYTVSKPTDLSCDYNSLPSDKSPFPYKIKEVHANNSGIMDIGFHHFVGCNHIDTVKLDNCVYIDDASLKKLEYLEKTLKNLEIVNCANVTIAGLTELKTLKHLENLKVADLTSVSDVTKIETELKQALPNCKFDLK